MKTRCYQDGVSQFEPRFQGKGPSLGNIFLVSTKLFSSATSLTQYRRVTDRRTDGIAVAVQRACDASIAARCKKGQCRTGQEKSHKRDIFHLFGDLHQKLCRTSR